VIYCTLRAAQSLFGIGPHSSFIYNKVHKVQANNKVQLEMWANAQRDGRPAEYRWHPLCSAAKFG